MYMGCRMKESRRRKRIRLSLMCEVSLIVKALVESYPTISCQLLAKGLMRGGGPGGGGGKGVPLDVGSTNLRSASQKLALISYMVSLALKLYAGA